MFSERVPHLFNILNDVESVNYFSPIICRASLTSQVFFSVPDSCVFALLGHARFVVRQHICGSFMISKCFLDEKKYSTKERDSNLI